MDSGVPVNYIAVVVAALANIGLGFLWYGPLFGKTWSGLMGWTKSDMEAAKKKGMTKSYALMTLGSFVMSFVLAHALIFASTYLNATGISAGLMAGFWNWLGFVAPVMLGTVLWDGKPWKLYFINAGYYLVALLLMGAILASF
jgi:hypothetical protein